MKSIKIQLLASLFLMVGTFSLNAQKQIKLIEISEELVVNVSPERAWEVINSYGDVGSYHSGITSSISLNGSENEGSLGCERQCTIENGKNDVVVDEKIIEYVEGSHYKYVVTRVENFPSKKFFNTFGVKTNDVGQTLIYVQTEYKMNNWFLDIMAKGNLKKGNKDALIFYKHYMETGEEKANPDTLRAKYQAV